MSPVHDYMLEISNVTYAYADNKIIKFPDFTVRRGESCLLLGDSGSGKTTLLHLLGGLLRSQHGSILIGNKDITQLSDVRLDHFRGKYAGFIFQKNHLINSLTVKKNLQMAPFLAGLEQDERHTKDVLQQLGLTEKMHARVQDLSHGQAQRVSIARAILNKPAIIFADEPTSALDDKNCDQVIDTLLSAASQNQSTLIIATHDQRVKSRIQRQINLQQT